MPASVDPGPCPTWGKAAGPGFLGVPGELRRGSVGVRRTGPGGRGWGGGERLSRSARRAGAGGARAEGAAPSRGGAGVLPAHPALAAPAHRLASVLPPPPFARAGQGRGAAAKAQCAGRAGLPADARRPGCGGAISSARASRGRRGRDQRATRLVVTPSDSDTCRLNITTGQPARWGKQSGPGRERKQRRRRKGKRKGGGAARAPRLPPAVP